MKKIIFIRLISQKKKLTGRRVMEFDEKDKAYKDKAYMARSLFVTAYYLLFFFCIHIHIFLVLFQLYEHRIVSCTFE